ncbi:MAG: C40 family peptidase [Candidatus Krumholzibacteria bacterium]|nr:C40 family peptidase [Candidatus Krumholzibacteria bacterium]
MRPDVETIRKMIDGAERERAFDWRTSWSKISVGADGALEVRLSRREVFEAVASGLGLATGPERAEADGDGIRLILAGEERGDMLWTTASVADIRRGAEHATELLTQAIMGETMSSLDRRGEWHLVMLEDGYHGWVRSWYVQPVDRAAVDRFRSEAGHIVSSPIAYVLSEPAAGSLPVSDITAGSPVAVRGEESGLVLVEIPGGRRGYLDPAAIEPARTGACPDGGRITSRAQRFLGITYVWGGTSGKGFDCSGLVKRVFAMEGIAVPRDSDQQAATGQDAPIGSREAIDPGTLLFFGEGGRITHVAVSLGGGRFVHAYGDVRVNSLIAGDGLYEERLGRSLLFARDLLRP